jgi:hypothetical protein
MGIGFKTGALLAALPAAFMATAASAGVPSRPTYTKDVAPIMNARCVSCHRPGEAAPMSLTTYEEVRPWAKSIHENVSARVMPPWHADKGIREFTNDRSLTEDEVATIVKWCEQGAKQGDPKDMPPAPGFPQGEWRLGEPDMVVTFASFDVPGGGPDQFANLPYQLGMDEDRWLTSIEVKPSNRKVTHHVIVYQTEGNQPPQGWLAAWAAGTEPMVFPDNTGRLLKKDATLIADLHYHPAETPETDATSIGLHFADAADIEKEVINLWIVNENFEIPAGDPSYKSRSSFTFPQDSYLLSFLPHMHYRGKSFSYTAKYPDGRKETLMSVSDYDFGWQTQYMLAEPIFIPKGTRIDCLAEWDNSANNPRNPDPTVSVRNGEQSFDEMMIGFVDYIVADGLRPKSVPDMLADKQAELVASHASGIYDTWIVEDDGDEDEKTQSVLYLPREGNGTWFMGLMGNVYEASVTNAAWQGDAVTATAAIAGLGSFQFEATVDDAAGTVTGRLFAPGTDEFNMTVRGKSVH